MSHPQALGFFVFLAFLAETAWAGNTYYIDRNGRNDNSGLSPAAAWRSLDRGQTMLTEDVGATRPDLPVSKTSNLPPSGRVRVNGQIVTYTGINAGSLTGCQNVPRAVRGEPVLSLDWPPPSPGDTLLVKAGEYRESVTLIASGQPSLPITVKPFPGDQGRVIFKGSERVVGWAPYRGSQVRATDGSNIWTTPLPYADLPAYFPGPPWPVYDPINLRCDMVFLNGIRQAQALDPLALASGRFLADIPAHQLFLALLPGKDPRLENVEVAVRQRGIVFKGDYLDLQELQVMHVASNFYGAGFILGGPVRPGDPLSGISLGSNLTRNVAVDNNMDGFSIWASRVAALRNVADRNGRCGMTVSSHDSLFDTNDTCRNGWRYGGEWHSGGVKIVGRGPSRNRFLRHQSRENHGPGLWFDTLCRDNLVEGCLLHDNDTGIIMEGNHGPNWLINNIICHAVKGRPLGGSLFYGTGVGINESARTILYHNNLYGNARHGIVLRGNYRDLDQNKAYDPAIDSTCRDTVMMNNIVAGNAQGEMAFDLSGESAALLPTLRSDYNLWYLPRPLVCQWQTPRWRDDGLSTWTSRFGQDRHSLYAPPRFSDPDHHDFTLNISYLGRSPAINRGIPLPGVEHGIADLVMRQAVRTALNRGFHHGVRPFGSAPDIGAMESPIR